MKVLLLVMVCAVSLSAQPIVRLANLSNAGVIAAQDGVVTLAVPAGLGLGSLGVEVRGTWTGAMVVECAASWNGGAFVALVLTPRGSFTTVTSTTGNGQWLATIAGCQRVQARATAAMTGAATVTLVGSYQ